MSERASFLSRPRTAVFLAADERQCVDVVVGRRAHRQIELHGLRLARDLVQSSFIDSSGLHLLEALRRCTSEQGGALLHVVATYGVRHGRTVAA